MAHRIAFFSTVSAAFVLLWGCSDPRLMTDSFEVSGPGDVDMLWVIDNSASMDDAQAQLLLNFGEFGKGLPDGSTTQMALTTTQAWPCTEDNSSDGCDDVFGTTGMVRRIGTSPALLDPANADDRDVFRELADVGVDGAQKERLLQATLMAVCEASDLPPISDFIAGVDDLKEDFPFGCSGDSWSSDHPLYEPCRCLPSNAELQLGATVVKTPLHHANEGLLRGNALHVVAVTDEGDETFTIEALEDTESCDGYHPSDPEQCWCGHSEMLRLLRMVVPQLHISVIGPGQGPDAPAEDAYVCNPQENEPCALDWHFWSVAETDGLFAPVQVPREDSDECGHNNFADAMSDLLLSHPAAEWLALTSYPDISTIEVELNGVTAPNLKAGSSCTGFPGAEGGWTYSINRMAVRLVGDCTPYPPDVVEVRYFNIGVDLAD
jgi:hypothetical protein